MPSFNSIDDLDYFIFDHDKFLFGRSGKQRSKQEAANHTNRPDTCGHSRKLTTKLRNAEKRAKVARSKKRSHRSQRVISC
ncbi:hypothetical protein RDWZM_004690 [Blomia tropicalis]|uniref:Nuclear protein 1 n=1 Tax=Blomia tropicalis TaxID=40697 RepID=A0A9Q0M5A4_BLOTA|nr:hypothetical protein BLOT_015004 [Blomia tropicalis]KAJ6218878.1 hypothetical protein RDWZM_004690 [Blomia tropicalis]